MVDQEIQDRPTAFAGRALVATGRMVATAGLDDRPLASFVTQLIACKHGLPAFRRAGRVEPATASRIYLGDTGSARCSLDRAV